MKKDEPRGKQKKSVKKASKEFVKKIRESLEKHYVFTDVYRMAGVDGYGCDSCSLVTSEKRMT